MPKSLSLRFNGNTDEVVDYARRFGMGRAMLKFQVKDYLAMTRFLKEAGGEDVLDNPKLSLDGRITIDHYLFATARIIVRQEEELKRLREELAYVKSTATEEREDTLTKMKLITESIE